MSKKKTFPVTSQDKLLPCFFVLSFCIWLYLFRGFLLGDLSFINDAVPYLEHTQFYINNMGRGVFPLWEPTRNFGVPFEFFMGRIGVFNPFYLILLIPNAFDIPFYISYSIFLALYYFLGLIGFYFLCHRIFQNAHIAFTSYLLLMFSSLSTILFGSFLILIFVPLAWFFYFFISFSLPLSERQDKLNFWGMIFCSMVLLQTYIPFYFLTIIGTFLMFYLCFYSHAVKPVMFKFWEFLHKHKGLVVFALLALIISVIPGLQLFNDLQTGEIVLPHRHHGANEINQISVPAQTTVVGGILATRIFNEMFMHLDKMQIGIFYVPIFAHVLFLLAIFLKIQRRIIFLTLWAFFIYLISLYDATPVYGFLYKNIFFFKYFRNFQLYLWLILLPVYVIICSEHLRAFFNEKSATRGKRSAIFSVIVLMHIFLFIILFKWPGTRRSSYAVVILSLLFFLVYHDRFTTSKEPPHSNSNPRFVFFLPIVFLLVISQPIEVYQHLNANVLKGHDYMYGGNKPYFHLTLPTAAVKENLIKKHIHLSQKSEVSVLHEKEPDIYFGTRWYNLFRQNLSKDVQELSFAKKFILYDQISLGLEIESNMESVARALLTNKNLAFIETRDAHSTKKIQHFKSSNYGQIVADDTSELRIEKFDVNSLRLKTNFPRRKFLVYNDNFHSRWQAFVDGQKTKIYRANIAFKGLWVPAGEHKILLCYGTQWRYFLHIFILMFFIGSLLYLLILGMNEIWINRSPHR